MVLMKLNIEYALLTSESIAMSVAMSVGLAVSTQKVTQITLGRACESRRNHKKKKLAQKALAYSLCGSLAIGWSKR